ncbi:MAG: DUF448 domain-containing protein [Myxococcota bacterium]|nr:DUF448 domain-containing protein [Myxococcota bacterium]
MRSCVACRTKRPAGELERLGIKDGRLVPDPDGQTPGRGAWVCPSRRCVARLIKKPGCLFRALKQKPLPKPIGLAEALREQTRLQSINLVTDCFRSGLVRSGPAAILASQNICALITATDGSKQSLTPLISHAQQQAASCSLELGLDRYSLGALVQRGPRVAVAILPGRPALHLTEHLQRHLSLS